MRNRFKRLLREVNTVESGHLLILALLWVFLAALIIPPTLGHIHTTLKTERIYDEKTYAVYAADSGIEDAVWHVKKGDLEDFLTAPTGYDPYDFDTTWQYDVPEGPINGNNVAVSVRNVWVPEGHIDTPTVDEATQILDDNKLAVTGRMSRVPASTGDPYEYEIKIVYREDAGEELRLGSVGVWLPNGFDFVEDEETNSLERTGITSPPYEYPAREIDDHYSGHAVVWDWGDPGVLYTALPGSPSAASMIIRKVTFEYTTDRADMKPPIVSWVTTNGTGVEEIPYTWDADMKVFHLVSQAGEATVEARTAKSELRKMPAAVDGDYAAIGNGLLGGNATEHDRLYPNSSATIQTGDDTTDSNQIPANAAIEKAYLYWAGWMDWHHYDSTIVWQQRFLYDDCSNFTQGSPPPASPFDALWNPTGGWTISSGRFRANSSGNTLEMSTAVDLSIYQPGQVAVSFNNYHSATLESTDYLRIYFRDAGGTWDEVATYYDDTFTSGMLRIIRIDDSQYLHSGFRIRFVEGVSSTDEYVYIDNVTVGTSNCSSLKYPTASPTSENLTQLVEDCARVNRVMFTIGTASGTQVTVEYASGDIRTELTEGSSYADTWSYACKADVTNIIKQAIGDGDLETNGEGQYTVGHVVEANEAKSGYALNFYPPASPASTGYPLGYPANQYTYIGDSIYNYCYAGWSLVLIYSSPELQGHQLYLFDDMFEEAWGPSTPEDPDFDLDGEPGGIVAGFMIPQDIVGTPGRMTAFVVEGDAGITGDSFEVNEMGALTSNYSTSSSNIWDSDSSSGAHSVAGVDIDTFVVDETIIQPGDTQAQINLVTNSDGFILVYLILSFQSVSTTGGAITYLLEL